MPHPLHVPRVNNNDDVVTLVELKVGAGDFVERGQVVGAVETDKAVLEVEADRDGFVLAVVAELSQPAAVGSVLLWLGETADEAVPADAPAPATAARPGASGASGARPTAGARARLKALGLEAGQIPAAGERLTEADIEAWLAAQGRAAPGASAAAGGPAGPATTASRPSAAPVERTPDVAGTLEDLSPEAHGMLATVLWHRDQAAAGYIEIEVDPAPWEAYAKHYGESTGC
jgi:pyruvate dehydrogenase E2 component (dihydrolipoamide acetyltransferase)